MSDTTIPNSADQPGVITLDASLNIADVATLRETLKCYVDSDQDLTLDGSRVEAIDTVSMQLLLAFIRQFQGNDCAVTWQEPSTAICNTAQLLGLVREIGLSNHISELN